MKYEITKLGLGAVVGAVLVGFAAVGMSLVYTGQQVNNLSSEVVSLKVTPSPVVEVVTPTVAPTATPAGTMRFVPRATAK